MNQPKWGGVRQTCLLDTYNQTIYTDFAPTISTRVDASSNTYIMEVIPLNPYNDGTARTIKAQYQQSSMANFKRQDGLGATGVLCIPQATKQGFIEVEPGGVFDGAYPKSTTRRGRVQEGGKVAPILCTSNELCVYEGIKDLNKGNNEQIDKANTREALCLLRKEIGEEAYKWTIGRLIGIFKEEILRCGMYEEGVCKTREEQSGLQSSASLVKENSLSDREQGEGLRDMWSDSECGCASQGRKLSEQFNREFNDVMSQLPHEATSAKECLLYLRRACEGLQSMQQALHTLEEVWRSPAQTMEYIQPQQFRIRKLSPRECYRLMGVSEENIDKIQAAGISNAQQYKMAGNSIVVDVLYYIFKKMFIDKESEKAELTLF